MNPEPQTPPLLPLAARLAIIQSLGITVKDDGVNPTLGNSRYIQLERIRLVMRETWQKYCMGVAVMPPESVEQSTTMVRPVLKTSLVITCTVTGESLKYPVAFIIPDGNKGTNACQNEGIAATYAERYAIKMAFGISAGDEDDAQSGGDDTPRESSASKRAHWSVYMDHAWSDIDAGLGDSMKLGGLDGATIKTLYNRNPANGPLMAWAADMILRKLQHNNTSWRDYLSDHEDLDVPSAIEDCTSDHIKLAMEHIGKTYPRKSNDRA